MAAASVGMMAVLFAQLLDFGYGRDQGIYATVGQAIIAGGAPYRDAWDFKPPGIFFLFAVAESAFGSGPRSVRLLETFALVLLVAAFVILSRVYLGRATPGWIAGGLAVLGHVQLEFWHTAQPESFGAPLVAWQLALGALAADVHRDDRTRRWLWAAAGVCGGAATVLKPMIGLATAGLATILFKHRGRFSAAMWCAGGFAIPIAATLLFFGLRGGFSEMKETLLVFAPRYAALAWQQRSLAELLGDLISSWALGFSFVNAVGIVAFVTLGRSQIRESFLVVGATIVSLLVGVLIQARLFPYHFGSVFPLTALLAGWGLWLIWMRVRSRRFGPMAFAVLVALSIGLRSATVDLPHTFVERCLLRLVAWTDETRRVEIRDRLYTVRDYRAEDNRLAAAWVSAHTRPDDSVLVYGFTPEIYAAAGRTPATRLIYSAPFRASWSRESARAELMDAVRRRPPSVVLVEHDDRIPGVVDSAEDSAENFEAFAELRDFVTERYARAGAIGKFDVYDLGAR